MNNATLRNLAIVFFALVAILIGLELSDEEGTASTGSPLFADLKANINRIDTVLIDAPGQEQVRIATDADGWVVENKGRYPASVGKIREVLLALADAEILEQKTANPDLYSALGVQDPAAEDSEGVRLTMTGAGSSYAVIIGKANQGANRYARISDEAQSVLIDQNPDLPDDAGGWLRQDLLDIDGAAVKAVEVRHADDELIRIAKASADDADFAVQNVPEGRELSYTTVANGIGSALSDLRLEDVRVADEGEARVVTTFDTFDGRRITVRATGTDADTWVSFVVSFEPPAVEDDVADDEVGEAADGGDDGEAASAEAAADPAEEAAALQSRVSGWQFKIPDFKRNQLTRRWEDILKSESDEE